ncbi:MAG: hypothetical protein ABIO70_16730 [Pseudomonadota bacterium]
MPWRALLSADPLPWILASSEPWARQLARTRLCGAGPDAEEVRADRTTTRAHPLVRGLVARLPDWEAPAEISGHHHPLFAPNLLRLLWDLGVGPGDEPAVEATLDAMLRHQDAEGRFLAFARWRGAVAPVWGSLSCDHHAIVETLVRWGRGDDPRGRAGLARLLADLGPTAQGPAFFCRPDPALGFRGPGRARDACPQVAVEALRAWGGLPPRDRPPEAGAVARTLLRIWRARGAEKPFMFGHGSAFKAGKWPRTWYDAAAVLEAVAPWPEVWRDGAGEDRRAAAELVACLEAYAFDPDGRVRPRSTFKGFEAFSFGQKKAPSPFATAALCAVLHPFADLAADVRAVDVAALPSSKGGAGTARPPR